jgi:hypothetical protein
VVVIFDRTLLEASGVPLNRHPLRVPGNRHPNTSSLTRQRWEYQQELIDESGDWAEPGLSDTTNQPTASAPVKDRGVLAYVRDCGLGIASAAFAGYVAGKVGVKPTLIGIGISYALIQGITSATKES